MPLSLSTFRALHADHSRARRAGFTLIEMMIVLVIIGILLGLAVPLVLQSLKNRAVYDAARSISSVIKTQRIRAQNLNVATGFAVDSGNNVVKTYTSTTTKCADLAEDSNAAIDFAAEHPDAALGASSFDGATVCLKPDGSAVDPSTGTAHAGGPVTYAVGRDDGIGKSFTIVVPYNGLARLDIAQ